MDKTFGIARLGQRGCDGFIEQPVSRLEGCEEYGQHRCLLFICLPRSIKLTLSAHGQGSEIWYIPCVVYCAAEKLFKMNAWVISNLQ